MNVKLFNIDENYQRNGEKSEIEHAVAYTLKNEYCLEAAAFLRICLAGNGEKGFLVVQVWKVHSSIFYPDSIRYIVMSLRSPIIKYFS